MYIGKIDIRTCLTTLAEAGIDETNQVFSFLEELNSKINKMRIDAAEVMDVTNCIASTVWTEDDIITALENEGLDATEENVSMVRENLDSEIFENAEHGNEYIREVILENYRFLRDEENPYEEPEEY